MIRRKVVLSLSTSLILITSSLYAKEIKKFEDLIVTAQKTEENIQKIPMSVNVLDEFAIEDVSIKDTTDIASYIPNFNTTHLGFARINIRGISNTGIGDPAVALYIDGISYADLYAFSSPLFDIERIEILKGPQGTLYGKNTEAGVINIITKAPSNEIERKINLELGNYHKRQMMGTISGPIIKDKLFLKLSALRSQRDGYIKNIYTDSNIANQETISARVNTIYNINENLKANLILSYTRRNTDGGWAMVPIDRNVYNIATGYNLNNFETAYDYVGDSSSKTKASIFKLDYEHKNFNFTSVTGYRKMDNYDNLDADYTPNKFYYGTQRRNTNSLNQEFRLSSKNNSSFKWLVGTYFNKEDIEHDLISIFDEIGASMYGVPVGAEDRVESDLSSKDMSIFGQSTLRFLDDSLGVTAGLRYEKSTRGMENRTHTFMGYNTVAPIKDLEKDSSIVLPKLTLDYQLNDDIMFYTTASKGYKAGGYSFAVDDATLAEFDPEISESIEFGVKSNFPNLGLVFNIAAFSTKVKDYQDRVLLNPMTVIQANVSKVNIKGLELETSYNINENFTFFGSFGMTTAKYGEYIDPITKENFKDNDVALNPKHDLSLGLKYRGGNGFFASVEMQNVGEKYLDRSNKAKADDYTLYNAKLGYEQDTWDIYLTMKNLTNKEYYLDASDMSSMGIGYMASVGEPRTFNVSFNYRF